MSHNFSTDELLAQATCAVWIEGANKPVGTAWLVSDEGHLMTAGHVLGSEQPLEEVAVRFANDEPPLLARLVEWRFEQDKGIDFAILQLEKGAMSRRRLPILLDQEVSGSFRLYGYGKSLAVLTGGVGEFIGLHDPSGRRLFRLRCKELKEEGFSGGAVYSEQKRAVVAIQVEVGKARSGPISEMVLAMPLYRIAECSEQFGQVIGHRISEQAPYRGLLYFDEEHAELFFGREQLVNQLLTRLPASPQALEQWEPDHLLAIVGASGSGKSSLVRAGLLPKLRQSGWQIQIMTPTAHPIKALAAALAEDEVETLRLMDSLADDARILDLAVQRRMASQQGLLLVVDQFEELFTLCKDEDERQAFVNNLMHAVAALTASPMQLILTLRADFYHHCAQYPALREAFERHQAFIGPMTGDELRATIVEPARTYGYQLEAGLVELILRNCGVTSADKMPEPGALPLLSHALLETWQRREGNILTLQGYQEAGGVEGAIAVTAEREYSHLTASQQQLARNIFLRLTELGEGTQDTRRRAALNELIPEDEQARAIHQLLKQLADKRLITTSQDGAEVAHEALIREWPRLREWLDEDRDALRLHRRLTEAAQEWHTHNREASYLYTGARLQQALDWAADNPKQANPLEQEFLQASQHAQETRLAQEEAARREREQLLEAQTNAERQKASRLRIFLAVASVLLVVAVIFAGLALKGQQDATNAEGTAVAETTNVVKAESTAQAEAINAVNAEGTAVAETTRAVSAEKRAVAETTRVVIAESTAQAEAIRAVNAEGTAIVETERAELAATQEAIARQEAEAQAYASQALFELTNNPDRALLLALAAIHADVETPQLVVSRALRNTVETTLIREVFAARHPGHLDFISVAFSPDGKQLLTGSFDETARLWDAHTGTEIHTLQGHTSAVMSVAFSPNGEKVLTLDGTVRLWDSRTGQLLHTLKGHTSTVKSVAFSPSGEKVVTGSSDKTARLWDAQTGNELYTLQGHTDEVWSVAFSPSGEKVVTGSSDKTARLWDAQTGNELYTLQGHTDKVNLVAFSPNGEKVLTGSFDGTASLWDTQTGNELHTLQEYGARLGAFSPTGKLVITGNSADHDVVHLWDAQTGNKLHTLQGHIDEVWSVAFSPSGEKVLTGSSDGTARLWDTQTGNELHTLQGQTVQSVAFSPSGEQIATGSFDGTARLWDAQTDRERHTLQIDTDRMTFVVFSPSRAFMLTGSDDKTARLWDAQTGNELHTLQGHTGRVWSGAFSPNGEKVLTGSFDGTARLWNAQTGNELHTLQGHTSNVRSVAFSPNGEKVLTGSDDKTARLWDAQTGTEIHILQGHTDEVWSVAFNPSGELVATGSDDGTARLWDTQTGNELYTLQGHTDEVNSVAFSPSGELVATGSDDGTARLWDVQTGQLIHTLQGHTSEVMSVVFSSTGEQVLTGSLDNTARLWDTQTGNELHTLLGHTDSVTSVAFSPTGEQLLTGSLDNTARLWNAQTGQATDSLEGHTDIVWPVVFSPSGDFVLTGSFDGTARLWIADNNLLIAKLTERTCIVWGHREEGISAEIPDWQGCKAELEAVAEDLARYNELRGE